MDADAFGLVHRPGRLLVVDVFALDGIGIENAGVVVEDLAQQLGLLLQRRHRLGTVRDVQVAAGLRIAVDIADQRLEGLHAGAHFLVQPQRGVQAVALDPLRALEPARRALRLPAVARAAAPADAVGFQHGGLDAVFLRQEDRAGQPGETRADDRDIDVDVVRDRTVVGRRLAGGADPVGRRVVAALAGRRRDQRVVGGIVGPGRTGCPVLSGVATGLARRPVLPSDGGDIGNGFHRCAPVGDAFVDAFDQPREPAASAGRSLR